MAARLNTGRKRPSDMIHRQPIRFQTAKAVVLAVAAVVVILMLPTTSGSALAGNCNGSTTPLLAGGSASAGSGNPSPTITFSIRFKDSGGGPPPKGEGFVYPLCPFS